jgi:ribosome-binding ATPase YchF (GTP1/OBG family)
MKVGLVGYSGSGKSTVFTWLTGVVHDQSAALRGQTGVARIPDTRLIWLSDQFKPKKTTYATLELVDTPGLQVGDTKDNPRRLGILREADGLLVVLNGYNGDPAKELDNFRADCILADLEIVSNRIPRVEAQLKKNKTLKEKEVDQLELDTLRKVAVELEAGKSLAQMGLPDAEEKIIRAFQLLTLKPELVLVNQGDVDQPIPPYVLELSPHAMAAPVKLEMELLELPEADRASFMADLGMTALSRERILREIFYGMGRIVFLTCGEDECRSWAITKGVPAQLAAGAIHTDLSAGFVRAEVIGFEEYQKVGSFKEAKAKGVLRLEGKTYVVQDGDIMNILANK